MIPKESIIVYRCESPNYPDAHNHPPYRIRNWSELPNPYNDNIGNMTAEEVCGCISLKQFNIWWPKGSWLKTATRNKYYIFSVPKEYIRKGKYQIVFNRSKAIKVGELTEYHKRIFYV